MAPLYGCECFAGDQAGYRAQEVVDKTKNNNNFQNENNTTEKINYEVGKIYTDEEEENNLFKDLEQLIIDNNNILFNSFNYYINMINQEIMFIMILFRIKV